jgi:light-regulated signal transduction histidine kinase (bacteriophytochrome)
MMDVPIRLEGRVIGIICHEHTGVKRQWLFEEEEFAASVAGLVALTLETAERRRAEARLSQTIVELRQKNADLKDFAYVVSHDLQEPLLKLNIYLEMLEKNLGSKLLQEQKTPLNRMRTVVDRMQALIFDLLQYALVAAHEKPFVQVDLNCMVTEVLTDLEMRAQLTQACIEVGKLPTISSDPVLMRHLFQNLIGNALKFHKPGEPPQIKIYSNQVKGTMVEIVVEDKGIGFEEEYSETIFKVFQRLHPKGSYEGNGIGLAICKKIMDRHGGHIHVQSAPGVGTKFLLELLTSP